MRPRWRSVGRRRQTQHPEGARRPRRTLLLREEWAARPGEESLTPPLRHRRSRRSRPSARSSHWRGRQVRSINGRKTEALATSRNRQEPARRHRRLTLPVSGPSPVRLSSPGHGEKTPRSNPAMIGSRRYSPSCPCASWAATLGLYGDPCNAGLRPPSTPDQSEVSPV